MELSDDIVVNWRDNWVLFEEVVIERRWFIGGNIIKVFYGIGYVR